VLNSYIEVSDYNEPYSLCQPLLPSPLLTLSLTRAKPFGIPTPLHLSGSNGARLVALKPEVMFLTVIIC
jgi:hypothetical protein